MSIYYRCAKASNRLINKILCSHGTINEQLREAR